MKKKKDRDPNERIRKIGARDEIVETRLTQIQIEDQRSIVCELLDDKAKIEEQKREAMKGFASRVATVDVQIEEALRLIRTGKRKDVILIEEWLTAGNEVIRIRPDTGDQVGDARRARAEELQEDLFKDEGVEMPKSADLQQNAADPFPDSTDAFGAAD